VHSTTAFSGSNGGRTNTSKEGVGELDQAKLPHLLELKYRAVSDAATQLGGVAQIRDAFIGFQRHVYGG
jgi:type I restriction enzyme R subunit